MDDSSTQVGRHPSQRVVVVELALAERALYDRMARRQSPRDVEKLRDGFLGAGWLKYREREGHDYSWPWPVLRLDAGNSVEECASRAVEFLATSDAALALIVGDASAGKSALLGEVAVRALEWTPLAMDWVKDPVKLSTPERWPDARAKTYRQLYWIVQNLISLGRRVLLEGTFKLETSGGPSSLWYALIDDLAHGRLGLSELNKRVE